MLFWYAATSPTLLPPIYFDDPNKAAFFFGEPLKVLDAHLELVLVRQHLSAPLGDAGGDGARVRHRHRARVW